VVGSCGLFVMCLALAGLENDIQCSLQAAAQAGEATKCRQTQKQISVLVYKPSF